MLIRRHIVLIGIVLYILLISIVRRHIILIVILVLCADIVFGGLL